MNDAVLSKDGKYRYVLYRRGPPGYSKNILWVMLNPSTADATHDDMTIKRVRAFSERWGCGRIAVCNLYAYRATDPKQLKALSSEGRRGPLNDWYLHLEMITAHVIVVAWGVGRLDPIPASLITYDRTLFCLGTTTHGEPRHPLYLPKETQLIPWGRKE